MINKNQILWNEWKVNHKKMMGEISIKEYDKLMIRNKEIWEIVKKVRGLK